MANLMVSKKVSLVGSWSEDIVTDEFLNDIATRAKTDKGKKMKVKLNEVGMRLTRARLLQESQTKFFPIKSVQAVTQSLDFPKCIIFILSDPSKKYKIIALRCESEADAAHLITIFSDIQNKVQSENIELKKRDNGNWTLRGRTDHNANRHLLQVFNENKQPNGEAVVVRTNGDVTHVPILNAIEHHADGHPPKDIYIKHDEKETKVKVTKKDSDSDTDDDYVIETEVTSQPYVAAEIHADHEGNEVKDVTKKFEHVSVKDHPDSSRLHVHGKAIHHSEATILPSRPMVYRAASTSVVSPQPVMYSASSRSYEPTMTATSAGYFTNPWAHRRISRESSLVPMRADGSRSFVKFDQQSIMSNTSRLSRSSKMRYSELSIPTTVQRSIENVYPRPMIILRRGREHGGVYRPRPASYHAIRPHELRVYHEDDFESGMLL